MRRMDRDGSDCANGNLVAYEDARKLEAELEAANAKINELDYSLKMLIGSATNNTGNEPSISVYHRALNEAHEALAKTPAQSLDDVRAKAVIDLIGVHSYSANIDGSFEPIIFVEVAEKYAARVKAGKE